ncbi:hypothetical protein CBM2617_A150076 [Cupriavidus taiwanensis]|nr:hypothetical protein CBM2617_A150076 [Cupriavidus taiwanensis]
MPRGDRQRSRGRRPSARPRAHGGAGSRPQIDDRPAAPARRDPERVSPCGTSQGCVVADSTGATWLARHPSARAVPARAGPASRCRKKAGGQHADRAGARVTAATVGLRGRLLRRKFVSARHLLRLSWEFADDGAATAFLRSGSGGTASAYEGEDARRVLPFLPQTGVPP